MDKASVKILPYWSWDMSVATTPNELCSILNNILVPATGVLFDLGETLVVKIDATDIPIPIGVVYVDENFKVMQIVGTLSPDKLITSDKPCRFFLVVSPNEVVGITPGIKVNIANYKLFKKPKYREGGKQK